MKRWLNGFRYALEGIAHALRHERHMRFHAAAALAAIGIGAFSRLQRDEWLWIGVSITIVWCTELVNTAVERAVDRMGPEQSPLAKAAKDTAAGAVLVAALFAAFVGAAVLLPALWKRMTTFWTG